MTIRVLEGPLSRLPAAPATLRERLGLLDTASDTAALDTALEAVLLAVSRAFCGVDGLDREWWFQTYEERVPGTDERSLPLGRWPVESAVVHAGETLVDPESYQVHGVRRDTLFRPDATWYRPREWDGYWKGLQRDLAASRGFTITYAAGWLSPVVVSPWAPGLEISAGQWMRPSRPSLYRAHAASPGTTGPSEPDWPSEPGEIPDGSVTWAWRQVGELPEDIQAAAVITAAQWYRGDVDVPAGVTLERDPTGATSYRPEGVDALPRVAQRVLRSYR